MTTLLIATRNAHKVEEIKAILGNAFGYLSLKDFPSAPEVEEDAGTFSGNATKKSITLARWVAESIACLVEPHARAPAGASLADSRAEGLYVLADDSGLEVDALNGAPGVHSARFASLDAGAKGNSPPTANNAKLLRLLRDVPREKRTARFRCVLALTPVFRCEASASSPVCLADEFEMGTRAFEGVCEGWIGFEHRGAGGFGYDPLFFPEGHDRTFGELGERIKNELSHRARALALLKQALKN